MKITESKLLKWIEVADSSELDERLRNLEEVSYDGYGYGVTEDTPQIWILEIEVDYLIENFNEEGHGLHDDLAEARRWLKETNNGKKYSYTVEEVLGKGLKMLEMRNKLHTKSAMNTVNEYKRLKALQRKVKRSIYG